MSNTDKVWWVVFVGICLIVSLPIVGDHGLMLFPLGRDVIFRLLVETILIFYLLLVYLDSSYKPNWSVLTWSLVVFAGVMGLATLFSTQPLFSFFGNPFRGHGYLSWLHFLVFFIIVKSVISKEDWSFILWLTVIISSLVALVGVKQRIVGINRIQSTVNNPNFFAAYILFPLFLGIGLLIKEKRPFLLKGEGVIRKAYLISNSLLLAWVLYWSGCRGAYIGALVGFLSFIFLYVWNNTDKKKTLLGFCLLCMVALSVVFWDEALSLYRTVIGPIEDIEGRAVSIKQRLESYRAALLGIKEKPLLGYGPENFTVAFDQFYSGSLESTGYPWFDKVHNMFLEIGVTTGILGLIAFLGVVFFAFWNLLPFDTTLKIAIVSALIAYLVQNMFNIDSTTSFIYLHLLLALTERL